MATADIEVQTDAGVNAGASPAIGSLWESLSPQWKACLDGAWSAFCVGSFPIGAIVTDQAGNILTRGRNCTQDSPDPSGAECVIYPVHNHALAHAELNALLALDTDRHNPNDCVLYTTTEPCPLCLGAFYMSGVRTLYYAAREPWAGSVNLLGKTLYLSRKPVRVHGPERAELENILVALHTEFTRRAGWAKADVFLQTWSEVVPDGVALGEELYRTGTLQAMRAEGVPTREMIERLIRLDKGI